MGKLNFLSRQHVPSYMSVPDLLPIIINNFVYIVFHENHKMTKGEETTAASFKLY